MQSCICRVVNGKSAHVYEAIGRFMEVEYLRQILHLFSIDTAKDDNMQNLEARVAKVCGEHMMDWRKEFPRTPDRFPHVKELALFPGLQLLGYITHVSYTPFVVHPTYVFAFASATDCMM